MCAKQQQPPLQALFEIKSKAMSHNNVSKRSSGVAQEDLKAKPPVTGSFDFLIPPRGDESMLEVCADFIEDAKAGLNAMRPKELCSACEMCDDHGRDMKLYQETQHPAGCHVLSSPSWACTQLSLLACHPTAPATKLCALPIAPSASPS